MPPREVWPHEAHDFTPWLLANVDVLSDLLGMDLVLDVAEHPVGGFALDLLGRDEATGHTVIVENQLEVSDHTHLGQILTYAAGTDPTTIAWVTTGFRPEHRAAIDWLNDRTDEQTRFFGVEIEVVRIGDSALAPAFKLVAQPNDWGKQVRTATAVAAGEVSERGRLYWEFWDQVRIRIQADHPGWSRARTSTTASWYNTALGTSGVVLSIAAAFGVPTVTLWRWRRELDALGAAGPAWHKRGPKGLSLLSHDMAADIQGSMSGALDSCQTRYRTTVTGQSA